MSRRLAGEATGIGKSAVGDYVRRAAIAGIGWPIPDEIDDAKLERRLFPPMDAAASVARSEPDWAHVHAEMKRRGVTLALLWQEYRGDHPQGFAYSWYCESYGGWKKRISPTMRQTHVGGEKVFVDFAGDTIDVIDPATGEAHAMKLFVAAMGASNFTYAEAVDIALCWGWIDGICKGLDEKSFLQRYTPRRPRSIWSQVNVDNVSRLIDEGRMTVHGLKQVEAANPVPTLGKPICVDKPIPSITALPCLWRRGSSLIYNEKVKALGRNSKGYFSSCFTL